ncbi:hypothetical protein DL96DRAFT_1821911 [Flagelloscypha sp. PMI_526]|nr:hypothetical protein DL96DRAFT_1821911 [Flagelloscypha sp. PMI_526]
MLPGFQGILFHQPTHPLLFNRPGRSQPGFTTNDLLGLDIVQFSTPSQFHSLRFPACHLDHLRSLTLVGDPKYPKSPPSKVIINSLRANWAATFLHLTSLHLKDIHNFRFSIVRSPNLQTLTLRNVFCSDVRAGSVFPSTFNRLQELSLDSSVKRHLESNSSLFAFMKYNNCLLEHLSFRNLGGTIREDVTGSFLEAIPSFKVDALRSLCIPAPSTGKASNNDPEFFFQIYESFSANPSRNPNVTLLLPIYSNLETFGLYVSVYWTGTPYLRGALKWLECEMVHVAISHPLHRISLHIDGGYPRPLAPTQWRQLASWETFDGMVCEFCTPKRRLHIFLVEGKGKFDGGIMAHRKALSNLLPQTSSAGLLQLDEAFTDAMIDMVSNLNNTNNS